MSRSARTALARKVSTYVAGSAVATVSSELTLVVCFGLLHLSTAVASTLAWLAGALPNYWINRSWTWRRSGRPSLRREVLPYLAIVLLTLATAVAGTHLVAAAALDQPAATRTALVAGTFLGVYVLMFVVRYLLLDRLFARLARADAGALLATAHPRSTPRTSRERVLTEEPR